MDFASHVNAGLMKGGSVDILSGVHGTLDAKLVADPIILAEDVAMFGGIEGVNIHNAINMTPEQFTELLRGPGTTIGAFCHSGVCLKQYK